MLTFFLHLEQDLQSFSGIIVTLAGNCLHWKLNHFLNLWVLEQVGITVLLSISKQCFLKCYDGK